ncbi:hypothetical protein, partial [Acinetobacter baumannii]|uniref:hypothetical protein n=1 Tax=Acinetobacter baumannii TaxID=470 RepID=UPI001C075021
LILSITDNTSTILDQFISNYQLADFNYFRSELSKLDWDACFDFDSVDDICNAWTASFLNTARQCIPNKMVTIRPCDTPWYNSELRKLKRKKERYHG